MEYSVLTLDFLDGLTLFDSVNMYQYMDYGLMLNLFMQTDVDGGHAMSVHSQQQFVKFPLQQLTQSQPVSVTSARPTSTACRF